MKPAELIELFHRVFFIPPIKNPAVQRSEQRAAEELLEVYQEELEQLIPWIAKNEALLNLDRPITSISQLQRLPFALEEARALMARPKREQEDEQQLIQDPESDVPADIIEWRDKFLGIK